MKCENRIRKQWKRKERQRRKRIIVIVGILVGVFGVGNYVLAEESVIKSKGNIKIEEKIHFYQEDFHYLQEEIQKLIEECKIGGRA